MVWSSGDRLIAEATAHRLLKAGNVGELLNWIAPQMQNGHAYGVWRWQ
jgi:hypothetical protein